MHCNTSPESWTIEWIACSKPNVVTNSFSSPCFENIGFPAAESTKICFSCKSQFLSLIVLHWNLWTKCWQSAQMRLTGEMWQSVRLCFHAIQFSGALHSSVEFGYMLHAFMLFDSYFASVRRCCTPSCYVVVVTCCNSYYNSCCFRYRGCWNVTETARTLSARPVQHLRPYTLVT